MFTKKLFIFIAVLALTTLACGVTIDVPTVNVKTGPTVTEDILIPEPDAADQPLDVELIFGAGELNIAAGATDAFIEGTAAYNIADLKPEVRVTGNSVRLSAGNLELDGIPSFHGEIENTWNLQISDTPMDLEIKGGAYLGQWDFGGLALTSLRVADGASDVALRFSEPNQEVMQFLRYETGASNIRLQELGNANFESLVFQGGAGNYELDFSGNWQNDATAQVEVGLSSLTLRVPDNLNVLVSFTSGLSNIDTVGSWGLSNGVYTHAGDGPTLNITVKMGAGNLVLQAD